MITQHRQFDPAKLHAAAWTEVFVKTRTEENGATSVAFDNVVEYDTWVDGKSRAGGTHSFRQSRGIHLPTGARGDRSGGLTITGLVMVRPQS